MSNLLEELKAYFSSTPHDQIMSDWAETEKYDGVGPPIEEFLERSKNYCYQMDLSDFLYQNNNRNNKFVNPELTLRVSY